jgi:hypothetical protein
MARRRVLPPACLTQNGRQRQAGRDGAEKRLPVSAQTIPRRPAPTPYFELLDPGIFLIEGRGYDNYNIDDKLIVYQERIQGIEEAVALLRVIKINPSSLSARAELISPVTSLRTKDRVDSKLENLIGTRLYPTANPNDHGIIGYFIQGQQSNGTILIFPSVNIEPGNILIEMAPVIQEEGIIVAYQPRKILVSCEL